MGILLNWVFTAAAVLVAAYFLPGVHLDGWITIAVLAVVLSIINTFIRPILVLISLPVTIVTLGLFMLVINAFLVFLASWLVSGFSVDGILTALLFSFIVSLVSSVLRLFFK